MTTLARPKASADAIICLYSIIHVPLERQPAFLQRCATWLAPGGSLLLTAGWQSWTGSEQGWLGGSAPMWWSHADVSTYRRWLTDAGLTIEAEERIPEGESAHSLFWVHRPA